MGYFDHIEKRKGRKSRKRSAPCWCNISGWFFCCCCCCFYDPDSVTFLRIVRCGILAKFRAKLSSATTNVKHEWNFYTLVSRDDSSSALRIKTISQVTRGMYIHTEGHKGWRFLHGENDNGESRIVRERFGSLSRDRFCSVPRSIRGQRGKMYLQETRNEWKAHRREKTRVKRARRNSKKFVPGRAACRSPATPRSGPCRTSARIRGRGR